MFAWRMMEASQLFAPMTRCVPRSLLGRMFARSIFAWYDGGAALFGLGTRPLLETVQNHALHVSTRSAGAAMDESTARAT